MKNKLLLIALIGLSSLILIANQTDSFVVQKKKVTASKSKLKEQNTQLLTTILQLLPAQIRAIADLQEVVMDKVSAYIEGQKNCFWTDASCERLDACQIRLENFQKQLAQMQTQLHECATFLNSL
jgi:7-cyano-7-deazaguanine synthase in queuosine biosynthesis